MLLRKVAAVTVRWYSLTTIRSSCCWPLSRWAYLRKPLVYAASANITTSGATLDSPGAYLATLMLNLLSLYIILVRSATVRRIIIIVLAPASTAAVITISVLPKPVASMATTYCAA